MPNPSRTTRALRFALVVGLLLTVLSVTGAATPKTVARLVTLGFEPGQAALILHAAPIVLGTVLCGVGQFAAIDRSRSVRFAIYGLLGVVTGFVMGLCLDLFEPLGQWISAAFGSGEARRAHFVGWAVAGLSILWALMMAAIAILGTPAARALQDVGSDPECAEVRARDRRISGASASGMLATGIAIGALTVLDQTRATGAPGLGLMVLACGAGALSVTSSLSIWKQADELQQRAILQAHAAALIVLTTGAFLWTASQGLGVALTLTAYEIFLIALVVQMVTGMVASLAGAHADASSSAHSRRTA